MSDHAPHPPAARIAGAPIRWGGWRPVLWVGVIAAVALEWCVTFLVAAYQSLVNGGVCFEPAEATGLQAAQRALVLLVVVLTVPWLVAVRASRHCTRTIVLAMAALVPACLVTVQVLTSTPQDFTSSWCLF